MVSVIIPTYNREETLRNSIQSILTQSYQDFEIIIVDDASTDDTEKIVAEMNDSRICYIKNDKRLGANGARNVGIQNAHGEYIAFQDSDDIWKSGKLEKQIRMFQDDEELDIVYSRYEQHSLDGAVKLIPGKEYTKNMLQDGLASILADFNVIGTPTMMVRRKCFYDCRMFDLDIPKLQDWEINIDFVQHYKYGFMDEVLVEAYLSINSITSIVKLELDSRALIVKKHKDFFETQGTMDMHLTRLINIALKEKRLKDLQILLGETLFYESIYMNAEHEIKKAETKNMNYKFIKEWIRGEKNSSVTNSFLSGFKDNSIALYGLGDIGNLFIDTLSEKNRNKIRYVIDRNIIDSKKYKVLSLERLKNEDLDGITCIIITAIAHEEEIRRELAKITAVSVISVYDVIAGTTDM